MSAPFFQTIVSKSELRRTLLKLLISFSGSNTSPSRCGAKSTCRKLPSSKVSSSLYSDKYSGHVPQDARIICDNAEQSTGGARWRSTPLLPFFHRADRHTQ